MTVLAIVIAICIVLREERDREWTLVYHDRRAWSVSEIDAHVSSL